VLAGAEFATVPAMSERDHILGLDRRYVWRPYTSSDDHEREDPIVIAAAEGPFVIDADGTRYIDAHSSWWTAALGHRHPRIVRAIARQCETLVHAAMAGATNGVAAELARDLVSIAPRGLSRVFFSDDGSTAVETAIKIAVQYWRQNGRPRRNRFFTLARAYHGDTTGAMSLGAVEAFRGAFDPILFEAFVAPDAATDRDWETVVAAIEARLETEGDRIAAVVVEPMVQGAGGMRFWPAAHLARLREATEKADTFLIADEVFTGLGRTGALWACDHAHVAPDLLCTAKALSGGAFPFAATLATDRIYDGFRGDATRALLHGHTFAGNPLGAAVAREVLAIYRDERVIEGIGERAPRIARAFERIGALDGVLRTRSLGMIGACDLGEGGYLGGRGKAVVRAARTRGVYLRALGDTIYVCPPLNIPLDVLAELLDAVHDAIAETIRT
jgi:adenosylmethionine-8-amino-7-oxononanoate aminotransferase